MARDGERDFEAALFASIELSPIATVITDPRKPDNPIVHVNRPFCALTGFEPAEAVGRNCRFLQDGRGDPEARAVLRRAVAERRPAIAEMTNYRKDGSPFRNAVMIAPLNNADGEVAYFLGSQMDVTGAGAGRSSAAAQAVAALTPRQRQVLELMIGGCRNKQIAAALGIDEKTVKMHRAALLSRLGAATSADAIRIGVEAGMAA
jgi:PAS domain S-box-containing protein